MNNKQLKSDGSYTSNVYGSINGYTELGMERKRRLMLDAKALLREVASHLVGMGLTGFALSYNPGGMAVSGDISAEYWSDVNPLQRVYITIGASFVLCGRKDGLAVMSRTHHYRRWSGTASRRSSGRAVREWVRTNGCPPRWTAASSRMR